MDTVGTYMQGRYDAGLVVRMSEALYSGLNGNGDAVESCEEFLRMRRTLRRHREEVLAKRLPQRLVYAFGFQSKRMRD